MNGYGAYEKYKTVLELLQKEHTIQELIKKTKYPQTTVYRMIETLLKKKKIKAHKQRMGVYGRRENTYKILR